jgi:hypothetical protein
MTIRWTCGDIDSSPKIQTPLPILGRGKGHG